MKARTRRIEILTKRSELLRQIRNFFYERDFIEVQTPTLSRDTMVDQAIDPIPVRLTGVDSSFYLQTSPEFAMKRLLAEDFERIFEITPAFRNAEMGQRHNPEFTMLEWYRVGDSYQAGMDLLSDFATCVLNSDTCLHVSYEELFQSHLAIHPHQVSADELFAVCRKHGLIPPAGLDLDGLLQYLMAETIESNLAMEQPVIIYDWPAGQSALAQTRATAQGFAVSERFELYFRGVELANGYHELTDSTEQRRRLDTNNAIRKANGLSELPIESHLLKKMEEGSLPESCGVAVGLDRLLMLQLGLPNIADVLAFDIQNA